MLVNDPITIAANKVSMLLNPEAPNAINKQIVTIDNIHIAPICNFSGI